jgi:primosomal protein N' (replication factor Y)
MRYYEVLVGDLQFHGSGALTYSWDDTLAAGSVIRIALRSRSVLGVVLKEVPEPSFEVKPIAAVGSSAPVPPEVLKLMEWLTSYYPAPFGSIIRQFLPPTTTFPKKTESPIQSEKNVTPHVQTMSSLPPLTREQEAALRRIRGAGTFLLHGITGSGKTRIYQELALEVLQKNRSVIVLTPEIGLTEHIARELSILPFRSVVIHSRLTAARRRDLWYDILEAKEPLIIIGPRSALFAPIHNVGLIIMDEAHDPAYKNDASPYYRTDRVAAVLAGLHTAIFVAGTATPNVEDYYAFTSKQRPIITLNSLAVADKKEVTTHIIDMRDSSNWGRSRIISTPLLAAIERSLNQHEQVLLFLNRRGTASAILCTSCGWRAMCPHCDLPLTYHADAHILRCHTCGRKAGPPSSCPECGHTDIILKSIGTKAVVEEIQRLFPAAGVQRFDTDAEKTEQIERHLSALRDGTIDIIVGTQMITKGLDLPKLSVVGVINADGGLMMPDFAAAERTYQLVGQVVGRVGRGHRAGTVILQTYTPENLTLRDALNQDYQGFYDRELAERQTYRFPPFCFLARLTCLRASSSSAEQAAAKLKEILEAHYPGVAVEGPSPAFHPRESGKYKWQLILKSSSRTALTQIVHELPSGWQHDLDPVDLL